MPTPAIESKTILIASCSVDSPTWEPVATNLSRNGYDVVVFEADRVALQEVPFEVTMNSQDGMHVSYAEHKLCLGGISAAWFRRPSFIRNPNEDGATQMSLDMERRLLQAGVWNAIPDERWVNAPDQIQKAEKKLSQLDLAQRLGFIIPETVITNNWETIWHGLPEDIICKSSYSIFYDGELYKQMYTTPFANDPDKLPTDLNPYPGIWQTRIKKAREWRITAVGDETFDAAIYTIDEAKDDWRRHQLVSGSVDFRVEPFPDDLRQKCVEYIKAFGLRYGAFDFIEDTDGRNVFLECNPNGQFMWLEHQLGLPISGAIASQLAKIAKQ